MPAGPPTGAKQAALPVGLDASMEAQSSFIHIPNRHVGRWKESRDRFQRDLLRMQEALEVMFNEILQSWLKMQELRPAGGERLWLLEEHV